MRIGGASADIHRNPPSKGEFLPLVLIVAFVFGAVASAEPAPVVLVVIEGLRPEFVTKRAMPNLYRLGEKGVRSSGHRAVFPTSLVVNHATILTGALPSRHGVVADPMATDESGESRELDANSDAFKSLLAVPTIQQILPDGQRDRLSIFWIAQPAAAQEEHGVGSRGAMDAFREFDGVIANVIEQSRGANVFVVSSCGVTSRAGSAIDLKAELNSQDFLKDDNLTVVGGNAITFKTPERGTIAPIVEWLLKQEWAGVIYTQQARPTHPESFVPGALSFQAVYMNHERMPDILIEGTWSDAENEFGVAGSSRSFVGGAGGGSSPYELNALLIADGPDIEDRVESAVPSAHYDLAPTICHLLGVEVRDPMDGRVLHEILEGGPDPEGVEVVRRRQGTDGNGRRVMMHEATVDGVDYLEGISVERGSGE